MCARTAPPPSVLPPPPHPPPPTGRHPVQRTTLWTTVGGVAAAVAAAAIALPLLVGGGPAPAAGTTRAATASASSVPSVPSVDAAALAALPEAQYSAVIGGCSRGPDDHLGRRVPPDRRRPAVRRRADRPRGAVREGRLPAAADHGRRCAPAGPVGARADAARRQLPSAAGAGGAAAQTAAWVPAAVLTAAPAPTSRVVISTKEQSVSIVSASTGAVQQHFAAGVGTADTPTPTGVTGYLEQRYVDPSQGTGDHPIQLTSLHSSAADEPYGGHDGGLIGLHWNATTSVRCRTGASGCPPRRWRRWTPCRSARSSRWSEARAGGARRPGSQNATVAVPRSGMSLRETADVASCGRAGRARECGGALATSRPRWARDGRARGRP